MHKWNPAEYAWHSAAQLAWARELIARLRLRGDESVLDIGSGDGKVTAEIAAGLPRGRVVGLDESPEMIEEVVTEYLSRHPVDAEGNVHVRMVRLEVEAVKP